MNIYFYPFGFYTGLAGLLLSMVYMRRKGFGWFRMLVFGVFWLYAMLILSQALFPIPIVSMDAASAKQQVAEVFRRINWYPFHYGYYTFGPAVVREVVLNFLITVPAGLVLPYIFQLKRRGTWIALLVSGFGIEILQLSLGLITKVPYRVVDISDVILNSSGFILGYLVYRGFKWMIDHVQ